AGAPCAFREYRGVDVTPAEAIAMLDRHLAASGAPATLRRTSWAGTVSSHADATVQAHVRGYRPEELIAGIVQGDSKVILSPTALAASGWPGGLPVPGDRIVIDSRVRTIQAAAPFYMAGELVRI